MDDSVNLDDISDRSIIDPSPVSESDLNQDKTGPAACKVPPELASAYPECEVSTDAVSSKPASPVVESDLNQDKTGPAACKVSAEFASAYPECEVAADDFSSQAASTQTCGKSTIIPAEKIGTCKDAQATLDAHNAVRARRGAAPLLWSKTLADSAQKVADTCVFQHSNTQYGENLAIGTVMTCNRAATLWINEESQYSPGTGFSSATGHFTQVVWKATLQVGCGIKSCSNGNMVVCQYYPAGNYIGSFDAQVGQNGEPSPCQNTPPAPVTPPPPPPPVTPPPPAPRPPSPRPSSVCCIRWFCYRC